MLRIASTGVPKEHTDDVRSERHIVAVVRDPIQRHAGNATEMIGKAMRVRKSQSLLNDAYALLKRTWSCFSLLGAPQNA